MSLKCCWDCSRIIGFLRWNCCYFHRWKSNLLKVSLAYCAAIFSLPGWNILSLFPLQALTVKSCAAVKLPPWSFLIFPFISGFFFIPYNPPHPVFLRHQSQQQVPVLDGAGGGWGRLQGSRPLCHNMALPLRHTQEKKVALAGVSDTGWHRLEEIQLETHSWKETRCARKGTPWGAAAMGSPYQDRDTLRDCGRGWPTPVQRHPKGLQLVTRWCGLLLTWQCYSFHLIFDCKVLYSGPLWHVWTLKCLFS